jgi:large subunit ribosomal protein L30
MIMYAVIRIKGLVKIRQDFIDTLALLRLNRKMHCVLLKEESVEKGMLQKVKDRVTWGEIDDETLKNMVAKRGRKAGNERLSEKEVAETLKSLKETGKVPENVKPVFRLTPPSKGFKYSIKQQFPKGELGYRGKEINKLLIRMM